MLVHRTQGEVEYLEALYGIPADILQALSCMDCVDPAAWVWIRAELGIKLRYLCKNGPYWNFFVVTSAVLVQITGKRYRTNACRRLGSARNSSVAAFLI